MLKKVLCCSLIVFLSLALLLNVVNAADVLTTDDVEDEIETIDSTSYETTTNNTDASTTDTANSDYIPASSTALDYEDSGDLSISNIINIILIVVGVVLILLGIAIIIRLK